MMNCSVTGQNITGVLTTTTTTDNGTFALTNSGTNTVYIPDPSTTLWGFWLGTYYPQVIRKSYPVYIQEKAMDKGKQAFELLKALMDKGLVKVDKVKDFIEAMDTILKTL